MEDLNVPFEVEKTKTQSANDLTKATWLIVVEPQRSHASLVSPVFPPPHEPPSKEVVVSICLFRNSWMLGID